MVYKIPDWVKEPSENFVSDIAATSHSLLLFSVGCSTLIRDPVAISKQLLIVSPNPTEIQRLDLVNKLTNMLKDGKALGIFIEQLIVSLWASVEAFVNDFLVRWIEYEPSALPRIESAKIKILLSEYMHMDEGEQRYHLLEMLKKSSGAPNKQGIDSFEWLLDQFGLGGPLDKDVKQKMIELSNTRNLLVHRRGIVDRRFVKSCPWLKLKVGDRIVVGSASYKGYTDEVQKYIRTILERVEHYPVTS